jgi:uncharacterized protein YyaL (SSP411 family)
VLSASREAMRVARAARPRPLLDDKVLTAWNGLMIGAFARAARTAAGTTDEERATVTRYRTAAVRAARFVQAHLWDADGQRLWRRWREGDAAIDGFAEDYAFLAWGIVELFQATGDVEWLDWVETLMRQLDARFADAADGGWFSTSGDDPSVLLRLHDDYDGAEPSATALAASVVIALEHLRPSGRAAHLERTLARIGSPDAVRVMPWLAAVASAWHDGITQIVIAGAADDPGTQALTSVVARCFLPSALVVPVIPGAAHDALAARLPWTATMTPIDGRPAAYVCRDFSCSLPVTAPEALRTLLTASRPGHAAPTGARE